MRPRSERALRAGLWVLVSLWIAEAAPDPGPLPAPVQPPGEGVERLLWGDRLDPNLAPLGALRALPGIGEARAAAIVAGRPYCELSEARRVRGIGPVTWSRIRDSLEIRDLPKECKAGRETSGQSPLAPAIPRVGAS